MKKTVLFTILLTCIYSVNLFAQDTIIFKSGMRVVAKVEEINKGEIKYRKFDNVNGPLIIVDRDDINKIKYINGTTEEIMVTLPPNSNLIMTDSVLRHKSNIIYLDLTYILFRKINFGYEKIVANGYLGLGVNSYLALDNSLSFQDVYNNGRVKESHGGGIALKYYPEAAKRNSFFIVFNFDALSNNYQSVDINAYTTAYNNYLTQVQAGTANYNNPPQPNSYTTNYTGFTSKTTIGFGLFTSPVNNLYGSIEGGIGFVQNYLPHYSSSYSMYGYNSDSVEKMNICLRAGFKLGYRFGNDKKARNNKPVKMEDYSK